MRHDLAIVEEELGLFSQDPGELNDLVKRLQDEVTYISNDRLIIADKLRALQARYDDVHFSNSRDLYQLGFEYRMTQRHKLGLMMRRALEKVVKLHKKGYFDVIRNNQIFEDRQIASIIMFRNICYDYRIRRQKKYVQLWFQRGLRPMD